MSVVVSRDLITVKSNMPHYTLITRERECKVGSWPMSYLGLPLGGNTCHLSFWESVN